MQTPRNQTAPTAPEASPAALADRVAALELLMQQLVFLLDAQGVMKAEALTRWIALARARMQETGSVPASQVAALAQLAQQVVQ